MANTVENFGEHSAENTPAPETKGDRFSGLLTDVQNAREQAIKSFVTKTPLDVAAWIGQRIEAAQYVTNGLQMATMVSEVGGIAQASILASIDALEAVKSWIELNHPETKNVIDTAPPPELSDEVYHAFVGEDEKL